MNILIIPAWYPSKSNEVAGVFVEDQVKALNAAGHSVKVIYSEPRANKKKINDNTDIVFYTNYPIIINKQISYPLYFISVLKIFLKLYFQGYRPDVIHSHVALPSALTAVFIKKLFRIPLVVTEHTGPFSYLMRNKLSAILTKLSLEHCDRLITVSEHLKRDLVKHGINKDIRVIHNMVNTKSFRINITNNELKNFLFVGGLETNQKGLGNLLEAIRLRVSELGDFKLVVAGSGELLPEYKRRVEELGLGNYIEFKGRLNREEVINEMMSCDLFILPSLHGTFGVVIIEALSCGKPVLSTKCGGPEEIITNSFLGELAELDNVQDLSDKLVYMNKSLTEYDTWKISNYVKGKFDSKEIVKKLEIVYGEVKK